MTISELCEAKDWHRGRFYKRTDAAAESVAAYINKHAEVDKRQPVPEYGCSATRRQPSVAKVAMN